MDTHAPTIESLATALATLERDWEGTEQALGDADAELERARAHHASTTQGIRAQRQALEARIQETRLALERQRAARAKAQDVIQETLGRATLGAILRARIEETCGDLDQATIDGMVEQALAGLQEPKSVDMANSTHPAVHNPAPTKPHVADPTMSATTESPAAQRSTTRPAEPFEVPKATTNTDSTLGGTSSEGPIVAPGARPAQHADAESQSASQTESETGPDASASNALVLRPAQQATPVDKENGEGKTATVTTRGKQAAGKPSPEALGTKVLTFEEGEVLGQRPAWPGNPFKR